MKRLIVICLFYFIVFGTVSMTFAQLYSVQVKSFPIREKEKALSFYNTLKDSGYFVYMHQTKIERNWWIRIKIGCYHSKEDAFEVGNKFQKSFNMDYWVNNANVLIDKTNPKFNVLTTPSGIWVKDSTRMNEVYSFLPDIDDAGLLMDTKAVASPVTNEVVFYYQKKIIKVGVNSLSADTLKQAEEIEGLNRSAPKFSFDGKYIAYMDSYTWELQTRLWFMNADGSNDTCLVDNVGTQNKVKYFKWHLSDNKIFYVYGYAFGGMEFGGELYEIEIDSFKSKKIVAIENSFMIEKFNISKDEIYLFIKKMLDIPPGILRITKTIPIPTESKLITLNAENLK